jgi:hypothetical protein
MARINIAASAALAGRILRATRMAPLANDLHKA